MGVRDGSSPCLTIHTFNQTWLPSLRRLHSWPSGCATLKRAWSSLWALRAEGWEWSGGLRGICPHLARWPLGENFLLSRVHLNNTQITLICFPQVKSTRTKGIIFACFLSPENDFSPKLKNNCFSRQSVSLVSTLWPVCKPEDEVHATRKSLPDRAADSASGRSYFPLRVAWRREAILEAALERPMSSCHTPWASTRRSRNRINSVVVPPFRGTGARPLVHDGDSCTNPERMAFVMLLLHAFASSIYFIPALLGSFLLCAGGKGASRQASRSHTPPCSGVRGEMGRQVCNYGDGWTVAVPGGTDGSSSGATRKGGMSGTLSASSGAGCHAKARNSSPQKPRQPNLKLMNAWKEKEIL